MTLPQREAPKGRLGSSFWEVFILLTTFLFFYFKQTSLQKKPLLRKLPAAIAVHRRTRLLLDKGRVHSPCKQPHSVFIYSRSIIISPAYSLDIKMSKPNLEWNPGPSLCKSTLPVLERYLDVKKLQVKVQNPFIIAYKTANYLYLSALCTRVESNTSKSLI